MAKPISKLYSCNGTWVSLSQGRPIHGHTMCWGVVWFFSLIIFNWLSRVLELVSSESRALAGVGQASPGNWRRYSLFFLSEI